MPVHVQVPQDEVNTKSIMLDLLETQFVAAESHHPNKCQFQPSTSRFDSRKDVVDFLRMHSHMCQAKHIMCMA